ncbi:Alpha/Beta hydrolase protein [Ephemerocybe angulata]|uniref:Carboxypeptidase n=1 Tax=Ephemerocybe angulata TaxID=980116 RepID=A0A8H6IA04_9AGAR|nr:Alpha/Beta hydrolase protein [Tulosesus angulatus]
MHPSGALLSLALALLPLGACQSTALPSSWPQDYPGKPSGDFSPSWQNYFRVTDPLPNVTFPLGQNYAGNLPVNRASPNNTLFFWGFEKTAGSLTATASRRSEEPWAIWLNGGPGSSSMYGFFFENGPIAMSSDYKLSKNQYSWDKLVDYFWIDQPVGVGHATATADGYVHDEDQIGRDFMGFLSNLVKVFPSLKTRPLHLTGESYAGMYIPYILKAYFEMSNPPVKIENIVIGDGTVAYGVVWNLLPTLSVIETFPQLIGYDPEVYKYFKQQSHLCGYDLNMTYPQTAPLPDVPLQQPRDRKIPWQLAQQNQKGLHLYHTLAKRYEESDIKTLKRRDRELGRDLWKRDLSLRTNGTLDPWYGCFLWDMVMDYALNYTYPWNEVQNIDVYDLSDHFLNGSSTYSTKALLDPAVRKALHAPTSKDWALSTPNVFGGAMDPSPEPASFLDALAANASAKNVGVIMYSGNNDFLIPHLGTEVVIQNTTFGGARGFSKKPSTPWYDDSGKFAGIIHQERGWKYALFYGTGHLVPAVTPKAAYKFVRDFVLGSNPLGSVVTLPGGTPKYAGQNLQAADELYLGAGKTESSWVAPAATRSAWKSFIATETATTTSSKTTSTKTSITKKHFHRAQRTGEPEP